jgi:hypothetical protein
VGRSGHHDRAGQRCLTRNFLFDLENGNYCTPISPARDLVKQFSSGAPHRSAIRTDTAQIAPYSTALLQRLSLSQQPDPNNPIPTTILLDGGGSLGALGAGLPLLLQHHLSLSVLRSYRIMFLAYSGLCLAVATLYLFPSPAVEVAIPAAFAPIRPGITPQSKGVVARLTALFSLAAAF